MIILNRTKKEELIEDVNLKVVFLGTYKVYIDEFWTVHKILDKKNKEVKPYYFDEYYETYLRCVDSYIIIKTGYEKNEIKFM